MFKSLSLVPIVTMLFGLLAMFGVSLPATISEPSVVALIMLVTAAVTAVTRFKSGDGASEKHWWQSKMILTQCVAAGFAALALFGVVPGIDQAYVVETAMFVGGALSWLFAMTSKGAIK